MPVSPGVLRFGSFALHRGRGQLIGENGPVALRPKSFALLCHFVEHAGRLLAKDELAQAVWKTSSVTDESIARCVSDVRQALGDRRGQFIKTLPGRGYLFQMAVDRGVDTAVHKSEPAALARPQAITGPPSLAVLPLVALDDYSPVGRDLIEEVIVRLSKAPTLRVIAGASAVGGIDERQAGRTLGARYVVVGSVRRADRRVRLNLRLVDVATAHHIWAERYDLSAGTPLERQDELAHRIAGLLIGHVRQAETRLALLKPPQGLEAYDLYLRGVAALDASESPRRRPVP